jgi:hypothetical protein
MRGRSYSAPTTEQSRSRRTCRWWPCHRSGHGIRRHHVAELGAGDRRTGSGAAAPVRHRHVDNHRGAPAGLPPEPHGHILRRTSGRIVRRPGRGRIASVRQWLFRPTRNPTDHRHHRKRWQNGVGPLYGRGRFRLHVDRATDDRAANDRAADDRATDDRAADHNYNQPATPTTHDDDESRLGRRRRW